MNIVTGSRFYRKLKFQTKKFLRKIYRKGKLNVFGSQPNQINNVYIINLDRQEKRWKDFESEAKSLVLDSNKTLIEVCNRVPAIDGRNIDLDTFISNSIKPNYELTDQYFVDPDPRLLPIIREKTEPIKLTKEEIAVALSHINCWKELIKNEDEFALILEDDVFFESIFTKKLNKIWEELKNEKIDMLYLSYRAVDRGLIKDNFSENVFIPRKGLWWFSGYILSKSGASKLLNELPVQGPIDLWINHKLNKINVFASSTSIIAQRTDLLSDNSYSILPILSQIGIQSDKTHLELENQKGRNPVFIFSKEPKNRLFVGHALSIVGYRVLMNHSLEIENKVKYQMENGAPLLFDVYCGFSILMDNISQLHKLYPEAVFITIDENIKKETIINLKETNLLVINNSNLNLLTIFNFLECTEIDCSLGDLKNIETLNFTYKTKDIKRKVNLEVKKTVDQHDVHPWIIPFQSLTRFGMINSEIEQSIIASNYTSHIIDEFINLNPQKWRLLEDSFPSNLSQFSENNFKLIRPIGFELEIRNEKMGDKEFSSASITSNEKFLYGKFDVVLKANKSPGIVNAFFLHRNDPWQEIDFEFLGNDTTSFLTNVYYNPGVEGTNNNYGVRGTPIKIKLGFDASKDFHKYGIEWDPLEVRWYVDDKLVTSRAIWQPTPIPDLPMNFYINAWPTRSEELAGALNKLDMPQKLVVKSVKISKLSKKRQATHNIAL